MVSGPTCWRGRRRSGRRRRPGTHRRGRPGRARTRGTLDLAGPLAVAVETDLPVPTPALEGSLNALLTLGRDPYDTRTGFYNALHASPLTLEKIERRGAEAIVRLNGYLEVGDPRRPARLYPAPGDGVAVPGRAARAVLSGGEAVAGGAGGVVGAPARAVGADDAGIDPGDGEVWVEPVETTGRPLLHRVHRAGEEAAAPVDLAVVETVHWPVRLGIVDQRHVAGGEIEQMEAALQRHHGATAVLAQRHRADLHRHVPAADFTPVGGRAEHPPVETVDPVEALLLDIPQRALAQCGLHVHHDFDLHTVLLCFVPCSDWSGRVRKRPCRRLSMTGSRAPRRASPPPCQAPR